MSAEWTAFPFKRALTAQVAARAGITGLTPQPRILTYFPSPEEALTDAIIVGHTIRDNTENVALGGSAQDEYVDVVSQVRVVRPGAGQAVADQAEDRARLLLAEVDAEVRGNLPQVGTQTLRGIVTDRTSSLFSWVTGDTAAKVCLIEFTVQYRARTHT